MSLKVGSVNVQLAPASPLDHPLANYDGLKPGTTVLARGHRVDPERAAFQADTIFESDVVIPMRDGINLRADIYRPATQDTNAKVPTILAWGPYGKRGGAYHVLDVIPLRVGVPKSRTSNYEKFEAPDPAEWTAKGYAIANVDMRGCFDSEGIIGWWGSLEANDGYDTIEWLAAQPWCNGSVAMCGNSWLAISQWFIAAAKPPHLKCIAPLEGASDLYREFIAHGGIPNKGFMDLLSGVMFGRNQQEDVMGMIEKDPHWNDYWEDKKAKLEDIEVPSYIVASYSTKLHSAGSFRAYERVKGPKWLRVHPTQEWHDIYSEACNDELLKFFDHYLKGVENDWESTPEVRISLLKYNQPPIVNQVFQKWPVPNTKYQTFYLTASGKLEVERPTASAGSITYKADTPSRQDGSDTDEVVFEHTFDKQVHVLGYPRAVLYMSSPDTDDLDVYVQVTKKDANGKLLVNLNIPLKDLPVSEDQVPNVNCLKHIGPVGMIRASLRALDPELSTEIYPVQSFKKTEKIKPGEIVKLEIPIWPAGIAFEAGEKVAVKISGHEMRYGEVQALWGKTTSINKGKHAVVCGDSGYYSHVILPLVEP
ncbi:hypothetical protein BFJ68_g15583 [Fusarium oxysporum]|uniref:Xaa-Pro dipeptidyl-peptidase C-terminal domain-containing protein n=2 Tax=Fusarium oxysporum TaxID=5507 RepID=A0A420PLG2_FUSOX|nr:hypothetical protein BFJ65_g15357 [Fusarium oxysporum f. sp. cepae]RKK35969.1 hypothetical protein BFJ66_g13713 [Fusarium oxysporum f. sp. cepae]RKK81742.1 hypothetical protein BFJ71_g15493 [Fusarium oxysporum]RKK93380.1 hypothetical protein BFJ68_g15583 [Fusarium oxysporum]